MPKIKVLLSDAEDEFRQKLARSIDGERDMEVVSQNHIISQLRRDVVLTHPDVAIIGTDGIMGTVVAEATKLVKMIRSHTKVLFLDTSPLGLAEMAKGAGASGYVLRSVAAEQILDAIRAADRGEYVCVTPIQSNV
jgi:DNA-binding NarL/FixJ family response regulator